MWACVPLRVLPDASAKPTCRIYGQALPVPHCINCAWHCGPNYWRRNNPSEIAEVGSANDRCQDRQRDLAALVQVAKLGSNRGAQYLSAGYCYCCGEMLFIQIY
jgi:hypothetical protein